MAWGTGLGGQVAAALAVTLACAPGRSAGPAEAGGRGASASPTEVEVVPTPVVTEVSGRAWRIRGARLPGGGEVELAVQDGVFVASTSLPAGAPVLEARGRWVVPGAIDSHVHLAYLPRGRDMLRGGIAAVVDLGAPLESLAAVGEPAALVVVPSGPIVTARGGYPTRDWGAGGFGLEVDGATAGVRAVDVLVDAGARVIKVAVVDPPALDAATLRAVVSRAHAHGLKVAAHALLERHAWVAAEAGVDVLAHTPVEPLRDATVAAWSGRAVISTLAAFGGDRETLDNLRRLREADATVLYGTDFGNRRTPGIDDLEIALLGQAGLDGAAILAAMTTTPRAYWGLAQGSLAVGAPASFLLVARDPTQEPAALAEPTAVFVAGERVRGEVSGGT